jgi:hypothetical protein
MAHGGRRKGSGRKKGVSNLLTEELRKKIDAMKIIKFLQDLVQGHIKGATISERKDAGVALLKKILPDTKLTSIEPEDDEGFKIVVEDYRQNN